MAGDSVEVEPRTIAVAEEVLEDLLEHLRRTRWPGDISGGRWTRGTDLTYIKELVSYWLDEYDWRAEEAKLNQLNHFKAYVDGLGIHFVHHGGNGPAPMPLFMMHGFPWSFTILLRILPLLTDPASHGGNGADAFTVIIPSLVGFGLSGYPDESGFGFQHHPALYDHLMKALGYERYGIEEGDWGGFITAPYGFAHVDSLIGIHLNCLFPRLGDECSSQDRDPDLLRGLGMKWPPLRPDDRDMLWY